MKGFNRQINAEYEIMIKKHSELRNEIINQYGLSIDNIDKFFIRDNTRNRDNETTIFYAGIENSVIVLNNNKGKFQLIDGFLRLLCNDEVEEDIIVKVYNNLTNEQFLHELFLCNIWKQSIKNNSDVDFFDRGFLLALQFRFNIKIDDVKENMLSDILQLFHYYTDIDKNNNINTVFNNKFFITDMKLMINLATSTEFDSLGTVIDKTATNKMVHYDFFRFLLLGIFEQLGTIRVNLPHKSQIDFSYEMFNTILFKYSKELKSTKRLSNTGSIKNRVNELLNYISKDLIDMIVPQDRCEDNEIVEREHLLISLQNTHKNSLISSLYRINNFKESHTNAAINLYNNRLDNIFFDSGLNEFLNDETKFIEFKSYLSEIESFLEKNNALTTNNSININKLVNKEMI